MSRYVKRKFTAEAVLVGCIFSLVIGFIAGLVGGLITRSAGVGIVTSVVVILFSLDVIFRGTHGCE